MVVNARERKSASGTSGFGRRAIRIGKATSATTPIAIEIQAARSCPLVGLAADDAERQPADGECRDDRAEPVEPPGASRCRATPGRGSASPTARSPGAGR